MIGQQDLGVNEEGHLDVVVTEVVDINKFWINTRTTDTLGAREKLMDCMDLFYNKLEGKNMVLETVYVGSIVAAPYYNEGYHRAEVIRVISGEDMIQVNYFDFGTVGDVRREELRILPEMFRSLPRQAIECSLWGVEDILGVAKNRFLELVEIGNRCGGFVAVVKTIGKEREDRVGLWLVDTSSNALPDGMAVNFVLLEEGLVSQTVGVGIGSLSNTGQLMSSRSSSLLAAVDEELAACKYVQKLVIGSIVVNVINLVGEAWVTSHEISSLVEDWQGRDILAPMLSRKKVELKTMKINKLTHPHIIQIMLEEGVKGATGEFNQMLLYRLVNIPMILNLFMVKKDRQVLASVAAAVQGFDPKTQFWI